MPSTTTLTSSSRPTPLSERSSRSCVAASSSVVGSRSFTAHAATEARTPCRHHPATPPEAEDPPLGVGASDEHAHIQPAPAALDRSEQPVVLGAALLGGRLAHLHRRQRQPVHQPEGL